MATSKPIELLVNVLGNISGSLTQLERAEEFSRLVGDVVPHLDRLKEMLGILEKDHAPPASIVRVKLEGTTAVETVEFTFYKGGRLVTEKYPIAALYNI